MRNAIVALLACGALLAWWLLRGGGGDDDGAPLPTATFASHPRGATAPAPTAALRGRVVSGGAPVAGAIVAAQRDELRATAVSDADGTFRIAVTGGSYRLSASAEGYLPGFVDDAGPATPIEIELRAGGLLVSGSVTDVGGGPIPGARIAVQGGAGGDVITYTRADGRYRLSLASDGYTIEASHDDYAPARRALTVVAGENIADFALAPGVELRGVVRTRAGRIPVPGAEVLVRGRDLGGFGTRAVADEDGAFELRGLPPGALSVSARARGLATGTATELALGPGERADALELLVDPAHAIRGHLVDARGAPLAHRGVRIYDERSWSERYATTTNADGAFAFDGLFHGPYSLHSDEAHQDVMLGDRDLEGVTLVLATARDTLVGRVEPLAAAQITACRARVDTDARGHFVLRDVGEREGTLVATTEDHRVGTLALDDREHPEELVVRLRPGVELAGLVVDAADAPLAGARVRASLHRRTWWATSDARGRFTLAGLPATTISLSLWDEDPGPDSYLDLDLARAVGSVTLRGTARGGVLRGIVRDVDGAPVGDARVSVYDASSERVTVTAADGTFELGHLPRKQTAIHVASPRGDATAMLPATPDDTHLEVTLVPLGGIEGRVSRGGRAVPVFDIQCGQASAHVSSADGRYRVSSVARGRVHCLVQADEGLGAGDVDLAAASATLDIEVAMTTLRGRTVDLYTGAPLAGIRVGVVGLRAGVVSDADGRFELGGATLTGELHFEKDGDTLFVEVPYASADVGAIAIPPPAPLSTRGDIGAGVAYPGGEIVNVARGGVADRAGLRAGDRITAIDGIPLPARLVFAVLNLSLLRGHAYELSLARGVTVGATPE